MKQWGKHLLHCLVVVFLSIFINACVTNVVTTESTLRPQFTAPVELQVEPCVDRTETEGRDLGAQATSAFKKKLGDAKEFVLKDNACYRLACEVTIYVKGSALKRWIMPGLGPTVGQVSAMLTDSTTGEIVIIVEGNATVRAGGLYTIGAEKYILPTAVDDVVSQLRQWALENPTGDTIVPAGTLEGRQSQ